MSCYWTPLALALASFFWQPNTIWAAGIRIRWCHPGCWCIPWGQGSSCSSPQTPRGMRPRHCSIRLHSNYRGDCFCTTSSMKTVTSRPQAKETSVPLPCVRPRQLLKVYSDQMLVQILVTFAGLSGARRRIGWSSNLSCHPCPPNGPETSSAPPLHTQLHLLLPSTRSTLPPSYLPSAAFTPPRGCFGLLPLHHCKGLCGSFVMAVAWVMCERAALPNQRIGT